MSSQCGELLSIIGVAFDVKRRSLTLFPFLPKPEVVFNGQMAAGRSIYCIQVGIGSRVMQVRLCGFRHISTSGFVRNGADGLSSPVVHCTYYVE